MSGYMRITIWGTVVVALMAAACDECETTLDCSAGKACVNGECQGSNSSSDADTDTDSDVDADSDGDTDTEVPGELTWISIPGGSFMMGSDMIGNEQPVHLVNVPDFDVLESEVTVIQYAKCVAEGECEVPSGPESTYEESSKHYHPVTDLGWDQANAFCSWAGGRMPSEAEWEYVARGGGLDRVYPWGDEVPSCDYCIMTAGVTREETSEWGCGLGGTNPVCGVSPGHTEHGLCDMSGNVYEWVSDHGHVDYFGAPTDGSAWLEPGQVDGARMIRGGGYMSLPDNRNLATTGRQSWNSSMPDLGFRCARGETGGEPDAGVDGGN